MDEAKVIKFGSKAEVFNGLAKMTRGKLTKDDLLVNLRGKVVSKKAQARGIALQRQLQGRASTVSVEEVPAVKDLTVEAVKKVKKTCQKTVKLESAEVSV